VCLIASIVYLNVFMVYLNIFQCTYSIYIYGILECMHSLFECAYSIFVVYFNVSIIYFNAFIVCFNVFQCVWMYFIDIVIEFHHYILIVTFLPCTPTYTFVFHSIQWLPSQHAIPLHFVFSMPIPTFIQSILTFHVYTSPYISHSTFHVVTGCAEHSGAQVVFVHINLKKLEPLVLQDQLDCSNQTQSLFGRGGLFHNELLYSKIHKN
jgi:hypothetical protein